MKRFCGHKIFLIFFAAILLFSSSVIINNPVANAVSGGAVDVLIKVSNPVDGQNYGDFTIQASLPDNAGRFQTLTSTPTQLAPQTYNKQNDGATFTIRAAINLENTLSEKIRVCISKSSSNIDCNTLSAPTSDRYNTGSSNYSVTLQATAAEAYTPKAAADGRIVVKVVIKKDFDNEDYFNDIPINLIANGEKWPEELSAQGGDGELNETSIVLETPTFFNLPTDQKYKACINDGTICSTPADGVYLGQGKLINLTINLTQEQAVTFASASNAGETSCAVGGVGWIVCPVTNFLASIADGAFSMISGSFLEIKTQTFATSSDTFKTWSLMRNFANVMFVIVFLVVVFSQMTSVGISNYGVKKMLPRLIIAAILVNISYFICQLAIDISNILGYSINQLLGSTIPNTINLSTEQSSVGGWSAAVGGLLVGGASVVIFWGSLGLMIPLLIAAALALLVTLLILVARQAIVVLLVVLAPIAFVAYLLPNTSNIYKFWQKIFLSMLVLFPLVSFVFGGSSLAASVLSGAFISESPNLGSIIIAAITALPLFVVPIILKTSLNAVPMLGKFASDLSNKANGSVSRKAKEAYQNSDLGRGRAIRKQSREQTRQLGFARRVEKGGFSGMLAGGVAGLGITASQIAQRDAVTNMARRTAAAFDNKELSESVTSLEAELAIESTKPDFRMDTFLKTRASDTTKTASERRAAMHVTAKKGFDKIIREMQDDTASFNQADLQMAIQSNAASLISKAPDLIKPKSVAYSGISGNDLADFSLSTMDSYVKYLNNLHTSTSNLEPLPANATDDEIKARNDLLTERDNAFHSFNSAIEDITKNPTLQAKFSGDQGRALQNALAKQPLEFQQYAKDNMHGLAAIQDDGKIR